MYQELHFEIKGIQPTIMHNGRLKDPFYKWTREQKAITSKRANKRTDDDTLRIYELEFKGSLYVERGEEAEDGGSPGWPGENIQAMIRTAAKVERKGRCVESGVMVPGFWKLQYDGPKTRDKLWLDERFRFITSARVAGQGIMRSRPRFMEWGLKFDVHFLPEMIDAEQIIKFMRYAGLYIGLSDWQRRYGMFEVIKVTNGTGK